MQKSQPVILHIETGGNTCSVALSRGCELLTCKEDVNGREHSKLLSSFIDSMLGEQQIRYDEIDAVALSMGPGSYTGLRIGVATAKGICYGIDKPLIAINSLLSLAALCPRNDKEAYYCPMIDARRLEVYTAVFDADLQLISDTEAKIIDESSFEQELNGGRRLVFFGSGAEKCKTMIQHPNASFIDVQASAKGLVDAAVIAYQNQDFKDKAYFEPLYLKDFVVISKKKTE